MWNTNNLKISNLFYYGFTERSVDLFTSHFKGRKKFGLINGSFSKDRLALYKVPKDPILFNLHKWPTIVNTVSVNIDVFLFVDDFVLDVSEVVTED